MIFAPLIRDQAILDTWQLTLVTLDLLLYRSLHRVDRPMTRTQGRDVCSDVPLKFCSDCLYPRPLLSVCLQSPRTI